MTLATPCAGLTSRFSILDMNATRSLPAGARTWMTRPSSAEAISGDTCALITSTIRAAVVKSVVFNSRWINPPCPRSVGTARSTVAPAGTRPTLKWFTSADQHVALRHRVYLAVCTLQGGHQQCPAAQALGIAHRRNGYIDGLPGLGERRQGGSYH